MDGGDLRGIYRLFGGLGLLRRMPFTVELTDKAGRGALCERIDRLAKEYVKLVSRGEAHEARCLEARLDAARRDFHRLYGKKEQACRTI